MLESYYNLFLSLGAILSILLSLYLLFYPSNFFANKILGSLILSWSIVAFVSVLESRDFYTRYPHIYGTIDVFTILFFPLMYIYIRTYIYSDTRKLRKNIIHFIPAGIYIIVYIPFFILNTESKLKIIFGPWPGWLTFFEILFNLVIVFQGIFYSILSLRKLHHFQYFRKFRLTKYQLDSVKWLRLFIIINVLLWVIGTLGVVLAILQVNMLIDLFRLFYFGLTILTLMIGVFTLKRPEFFTEKEDIAKYTFRKISPNDLKTPDESMINEADLLMEYIRNEKPYLKPDLKMQDLVNATGLSYKRISEIFNNEIKQSFFDIINDYRMQMVISLINSGFHKKHNLAHLAEQAGFNSKATFNRIFKKYTGKTPTEYIDQMDL